jgi:hypothetical protein
MSVACIRIGRALYTAIHARMQRAADTGSQDSHATAACDVRRAFSSRTRHVTGLYDKNMNIREIESKDEARGADTLFI